jgi:hypothetical protein
MTLCVCLSRWLLQTVDFSDLDRNEMGRFKVKDIVNPDVENALVVTKEPDGAGAGAGAGAAVSPGPGARVAPSGMHVTELSPMQTRVQSV